MKKWRFPVFKFRLNSRRRILRRGPRLSVLGDALKAELPEAGLKQVNLDTDQVVATFTRPLDPALYQWCKSGPNRWLEVTRESGDGPWLGVCPE